MNVDFSRHCGGEHLPGASLSSARPLWTSEGRLRGPQRTQAPWDTRQIATGPGQRGDIFAIDCQWLRPLPWHWCCSRGVIWIPEIEHGGRNKTQFTCIVISTAQQGATSAAHKGIKTYDDWSAGSPARQRSAIWRPNGEQSGAATSRGLKVKFDRAATNVSYGKQISICLAYSFFFFCVRLIWPCALPLVTVMMTFKIRCGRLRMIKDQELQRSQMFLCGAQYDVEPLLLTGC